VSGDIGHRRKLGLLVGTCEEDESKKLGAGKAVKIAMKEGRVVV
jgi:hypothetical protein